MMKCKSIFFDSSFLFVNRSPAIKRYLCGRLDAKSEQLVRSLGLLERSSMVCEASSSFHERIVEIL
jgi:hypothetical protein